MSKLDEETSNLIINSIINFNLLIQKYKEYFFQITEYLNLLY